MSKTIITPKEFNIHYNEIIVSLSDNQTLVTFFENGKAVYWVRQFNTLQSGQTLCIGSLDGMVKGTLL